MPEPIPSPEEPPDRWAGLRAAFAPKPPSEGELDKLRAAVAEAAGLLRTYTVGYLTVALYLVVTAANTTHEQLLIGKEITLPIVDVGVPLVGFYVLAPAVFVALHSNLLFHLEALALRLQEFGERAAVLDQPSRRRARLLLVPFQFVDWHARSDEIGLDRAFYGVAAWLLYFASGSAVLLTLQLGSLPYQHDFVTPWHVLCIAADAESAWRFSRTLRSLGRTARPSRWPGRLARASAYLGLFTSLGLWADIDMVNAFSRIEVPNGVLMAEVPSADQLGAYRQELRERKGLSVEEAEIEAMRALGKPIDLSGRNLRNARLWSARMMGADLGEARLEPLLREPPPGKPEPPWEPEALPPDKRREVTDPASKQSDWLARFCYVEAMRKRDGRSIPDAALGVLRERAVAMHEAGNAQLAIAAALGVHKNTVHRWLKGWRVAGSAALKTKKRGRRHGAQRLLDAGQAAEVQRLMTEHTPDQLERPWALWGREAVRDLARARFGVTLALRTVSDYLRRWRFTPQRPVKRALERQDAAIQAWLAGHDPKIAARAKAEGAVIHGGDETGISNQAAVHGRSFAPKGKTPVLRRRPATRRTLSMISAVTNRGTLRFMLDEGALNTTLFLTFLQRLLRSARSKVFLIVDNLKVHKAGKVQAWVAQHQDKIELVFLPAYAPERNPDEFLHSDLKRSLGRRPVARDKAGLESRLRGYLRRLQRQPERVRAFFRAPTTRYAA